MSSWRECKLVDIAEILNHVRVPLSAMERAKKQGNFPYYGASGIIDYIDDYLFDGEYVLISEDGENLKSRKTPIAFKANGKFWVNNHAHIIQGKKPFLNDLIVYFFKNLDLNEYITGAVQPKLNKANLLEIPFYLPESDEEQKAIAEVLSSLDDKIDLLHRQNKTLEALAQTLFRQWFIEEAKEEWEEVTLSDVMELKYGKDHKHLNDGKIPIYGSGGIMRYGDTAIYKQESILIPRKGTLNNIFYVDEPFWTVDTIFWSKINSEKISGKLLFEFLKTLNFSNMNVGSAVPSLTTKVLNEISFALPSLKEQEEFKIYTDNAWDKIKQNQKQIQTLENLRDILLPKLLSGEIRVVI